MMATRVLSMRHLAAAKAAARINAGDRIVNADITHIATGWPATAVVHPLARIWLEWRSGDGSRMMGDCQLRL
jgi:hypothetical protein